jgi:hypothetical protein
MYRKIDTRLWNDEKFRSFDSATRDVWEYILMNPQGNQVGLCVWRHEFALSDLIPHWQGHAQFLIDLAREEGVALPQSFIEQLIGSDDRAYRRVYHRAWVALTQALMLDYHEPSRVLFIRNFLRYEPPHSHLNVLGWKGVLDDLPRGHPYFPALRDSLAQNVPLTLRDQCLEAFDSIIPDGVNSQARARGRATPRAIPRAGVPQEQEQEQDLLPTDRPAKERIRANSQPTSPPTIAPGVISQELKSVILAMQVEGFHILAEPTKANQVFWGAQIELVESHDGVDLFACLRDVDAYYATSPEEWPKDRPEAARRMKSAIAVAITKIQEAQQQRQERRRPYVKRAAG